MPLAGERPAATETDSEVTRAYQSGTNQRSGCNARDADHDEHNTPRQRQRAFEEEQARELYASIIQAHARRKSVQIKRRRVEPAVPAVPEVSLRPGGSIGFGSIGFNRFHLAAAPKPNHASFMAGTAVVAKYADSSRTWKQATVVASVDGLVTVRFDGYTDTVDLPSTRVKIADKTSETARSAKKERRPKAFPARAPLQPATQLPKAATPSEQAVCTVRSCLSKLSPDNFERIATKVVAIEVDNIATLTALVELMFERAVIETHFTEIYARLFARCAEQMPSFEESGVNITFRKLLLNKSQREFEGGGERKRKLGTTLFVGQLWLHGLLGDAIVHGCVAQVLHTAECGEDGGEDGGELASLQTDAVEVACTLLGVIGSKCDASATGRARVDAYMARMRGWAADKEKLPAARIRFKVMDVLDARKKGWKAGTK